MARSTFKRSGKGVFSDSAHIAAITMLRRAAVTEDELTSSVTPEELSTALFTQTGINIKPGLLEPYMVAARARAKRRRGNVDDLEDTYASFRRDSVGKAVTAIVGESWPTTETYKLIVQRV